MGIIETYSKYLTFTKRYSRHTVEAYQNDLEQFSQFLENIAPENNLISAKHAHVRHWLLSLVEQGIASRSVNRKITSLKSFYKFLQQQNIIEVNPAIKVESLRSEKKLPVFVKEDQIEFLFDEISFGSEYENFRNKIILELLYLTGIRLSELVNLKESDVDVSAKTLKVLGKRNKERIIPLDKLFVDRMQAFIIQKKLLFSNKYVFLTKKGGQVYPKLIYRVVNKYLTMVSTQKKKSPHVLRHTFATHMLNNGADLNAIKEILGHANLSATEIYTHVSFEKLKSIYKQAHPRAIIMED